MLMLMLVRLVDLRFDVAVALALEFDEALQRRRRQRFDEVQDLGALLLKERLIGELGWERYYRRRL